MDPTSARNIERWLDAQERTWTARFPKAWVGLGSRDLKTMSRVLCEFGNGVVLTIRGREPAREIHAIIAESLARDIQLPAGFGNISIRRTLYDPSKMPQPDQWADHWVLTISAEKQQRNADQDEVPLEPLDSGRLERPRPRESACVALQAHVGNALGDLRLASRLSLLSFPLETDGAYSGPSVFIEGFESAEDSQAAMAAIIRAVPSVNGVVLFDTRVFRFTGLTKTWCDYAVQVYRHIKPR